MVLEQAAMARSTLGAEFAEQQDNSDAAMLLFPSVISGKPQKNVHTLVQGCVHSE